MQRGAVNLEEKAERERMGREGREGENYVIIIAKNIVDKEITFNL